MNADMSRSVARALARLFGRGKPKPAEPELVLVPHWRVIVRGQCIGEHRTAFAAEMQARHRESLGDRPRVVAAHRELPAEHVRDEFNRAIATAAADRRDVAMRGPQS